MGYDSSIDPAAATTAVLPASEEGEDISPTDAVDINTSPYFNVY